MSYKNGIYISVYPTKDSIALIEDFTSDIPFERNSLEPHVTLMYHKGKVDEDALPNPNMGLRFPSTCIGFRTWYDHKHRPILVMLLSSFNLLNRHSYWARQGLRHTFPYCPHLTLTDSKGNNSFMDVEAYCSILNHRLLPDFKPKPRLNITLNRETMTELNAGSPRLIDPNEEMYKFMREGEADYIFPNSFGEISQVKLPKPRLKQTRMKERLPKTGPKPLPKVGPKRLTLKRPGTRKKR